VVIKKSCVVAQTWNLGELVAAEFIDQNGDRSFHMFDPDAFDELRAGARLPRYCLPSHEFVGPLPQGWAHRVRRWAVGDLLTPPPQQ